MNIKSTLAGTLAALTVLTVAGGPLQTPAAQAAEPQGLAASCSFTTNLTLGSNGESVRALQVFLNTHGYPVAVTGPGSRGSESTYFGGLTRVALARYQAAKGISPAVGYFGPITRARVNAECVPNPDPTPTSTDPTLNGGEADLSNFRLRREQSSGAEGEEGVAIGTASFDVDDGDVRVERIEIVASSTNQSLSVQPWKYLDKVEISANGRTLAAKDTDTRADWSEVRNGVYRLTVPSLNYVVREGKSASLTVSADIKGNIDSQNLAQEFAFSVGDRGIRATDGAGIQQYVGNDTQRVTFGFDDEQNGDLRVSSSDEDPDSSILVADDRNESDEYTVFAFDVENRDDVDSVITDLTIDVTGMNAGVNADDVLRRATLVSGRDRFDGRIQAGSIVFDNIDLGVDGDDTANLELRVRLARNATTTPIAFAVSGTGIEAEGVRSGDTADVTGAATSETHAIARAGIAVVGTGTSQTVTTVSNTQDSYGTYQVKFRVTAKDEDAYIATTTDDTGTVGVQYLIGGNAFSGTDTSYLSSTAPTQNGFYVVREGRTETFTLTVVLNPDTAGTFFVRLDSVRFNDAPSFTNSIVYTASPNNTALQTNPVFIPN